MSIVLKRPIRSLPIENKSKAIQVKVKEMTWKHVFYWNKHVQPLINQNYFRAEDESEPEKIRADVGWQWGKYFLMASMQTGYSSTPGVKSGPAHALVIAAINNAGDEIPLGMLTVVPQFYCNVSDLKKIRTFTWYLSDAPGEFYQTMNLDAVRRVASSLLDTAIQTGLEAGLTGELLLHADKKGGDKLKDFYKYCGMSELDVDAPRVSILRWQGLDRYFYFDENSSKKFCSKFDLLR